MAKETTLDCENSTNRTSQCKHDELNNKKAMSNTEITKECIDQLIENIDYMLKASK